MADETIGLDLEVRLEGAQSVKELRQILKDARDEAIKFGEGSAGFQKFTKIAAEAEDQMRGVREAIAGLDPGAKAQQFQILGQTMVGGFQAATGALAVFTGDNEQLNAILLKSMAIVQGMQGVQAIADTKKYMGIVKNILGIKAETAATQQLTGAVKGQAAAQDVARSSAVTLRGALIATGVGALVVAVGMLIANFDKVKKVVTDLFPIFNNLGNITDKIQAGLNGLWQGFLQTFKNIGESINLLLTGNFKAALAKIADLESVGKAAAKGYHDELQSIADEAAKVELQKLVDANKRLANEMEAAGKNTYALRRKILQDELSLLDKDAEDYATLYADKQSEIRVLDASHRKQLSDAAKVELDKKNAEAAKQAEKDKAEAEKKLKEAQDLEKKKKDIRDQFAEDKLQYELSEQERELLEVERKKQAAIDAGVSIAEAEGFARLQIFDINRKYDQLELEAQIETNKKSEDALKASNDKKIEDGKRLREAQLSLTTSLATGIANIGILMTNNAKKQETFNKVSAGIQIGIDTARGITSAVAAAKGLTGFDYVAQVALGVGSVLANAAKAKQLLSKVGGSAPSIDTGAISAAQQSAQQTAPSFNPANQSTTLDEAERRRASGGQGSNTIRAYVVETEMSERQKRISDLEDRSVE